MSKGKKLAVYAGVLAILIAAVIVISIVQKNGSAGESDVSSQTSSFVYHDDAVLISSHTNKTDISEVHVKNKDVEYTLEAKVVKSTDSFGAEKEELQWTWKENPDLVLNDTSIGNLIGLGYNLRALKTIAEDYDHLEYYGLDDPTGVVEFTYTDGTTTTVTVGNSTMDNVYCYAMSSDTQGVFSAYKSIQTYSAYNLTNLLKITVPPIRIEQEMTYLELYQKGKNPVIITLREEDDVNETVYDYGAYKFLYPYTNPTAVVKGELTDYYQEMVSPTIVSIVDASAEDLGQYGLSDEDPEYHVHVKNRVEQKDGTYKEDDIEYFFGTRDEDGNLYFRLAGSKTVCTVDAASLDVFRFDPFDYLQRLMYIYNIRDIESFRITSTAPERDYTVRILRKDVEGTNSKGESETETLEVFYLNDKLLETKLAKALYTDCIGLMMDYEMPEKPEMDTSDKVTITFTRTDGVEFTVEYNRMDEYYYAAPFGEVWMALNKMQFDSMWDEYAEAELAD